MSGWSDLEEFRNDFAYFWLSLTPEELGFFTIILNDAFHEYQKHNMNFLPLEIKNPNLIPMKISFLYFMEEAARLDYIDVSVLIDSNMRLFLKNPRLAFIRKLFDYMNYLPENRVKYKSEYEKKMLQQSLSFQNNQAKTKRKM